MFPESRGIAVSHILLSYPLGPRSWLTAFRGAHYTSTLANLLKDSRARVLVIYGDEDDFTGVENYDSWANSLRSVARGEGKAQLEIVKVANANHFWTDDQSREALVHAVRNFV